MIKKDEALVNLKNKKYKTWSTNIYRATKTQLLIKIKWNTNLHKQKKKNNLYHQRRSIVTYPFTYLISYLGLVWGGHTRNVSMRGCQNWDLGNSVVDEVHPQIEFIIMGFQWMDNVGSHEKSIQWCFVEVATPGWWMINSWW